MVETPDNSSEARKVVEQFLDKIESETEWQVVDYDPHLDVYDGVSVQLNAEFNPVTEKYDADIIESGGGGEKPWTIKEIVSDLENDNEDGAPYDLVVNVAQVELNISDGEATEKLEALRSNGEIYEPAKNHLRTT